MKVGQKFYMVSGDESVATIKKIENGTIYYTTNVQIGKGFIELPEENFLANWKETKQKPIENAPIVDIKGSIYDK